MSTIIVRSHRCRWYNLDKRAWQEILGREQMAPFIHNPSDEGALEPRFSILIPVLHSPVELLVPPLSKWFRIDSFHRASIFSLLRVLTALSLFHTNQRRAETPALVLITSFMFHYNFLLLALLFISSHHISFPLLRAPPRPGQGESCSIFRQSPPQTLLCR